MQNSGHVSFAPCLLLFEEFAISRSRKFQGYRTLGTSNFANLGSELKAKEPDARTQHCNNDYIG
jgi:hypothetical protein